MTLEELNAIPLIYTYGYRANDHALRQYQNFEHKIAKQIYTPRKVSTGEWGKQKTTYMLTDTKEEFNTLQDLLYAINTRSNT